MLFTNIQAFLSVVNCGSFNKATTFQNISATAIMKRLNNLETELNVKLLVRDKHGVTLTDAGKAFYNDTKLLSTYLDQCIERVKKINAIPHAFRIGASPISPTNFFIDIWPFINKQNPNLNLELIACEDVIKSHYHTLRDKKLAIDAMLGVFDKEILKREGINGIEICALPFYICAPSAMHVLATRTHLTFDDFKGFNVYVIKRFDSKAITSLKEKFIHAGANIKVFQGYDIDLIDEVVKTNSLLVCFSNVKRIRPDFKILDINLNESITFGLMYENKKSVGLQSFLEAYNQYKDSISTTVTNSLI